MLFNVGLGFMFWMLALAGNFTGHFYLKHLKLGSPSQWNNPFCFPFHNPRTNFINVGGVKSGGDYNPGIKRMLIE